MLYQGHVTPGGPPATRELAHLTITKLSVGPMDNNAYLLRCRDTGEQLLIDAAAEPDRLLDLIGPERIATVVTTHWHQDHWGALGDVVRATGAYTIASKLDSERIDVPSQRLVTDGDIIEVGEVGLEVITLQGHTECSIALLYNDPAGTAHLFTGDTLFPGGIGNTFGDAENFQSLLADVRQKFFRRLPDSTWFYPGHGDDSTLGAERPHLEEWAERGW